MDFVVYVTAITIVIAVIYANNISFGYRDLLCFDIAYVSQTSINSLSIVINKSIDPIFSICAI